jgi:hypothetical protein
VIALTKAQRESLFRLFRRDFPSWVTPCITRENMLADSVLPSSIQAVCAHCRSRLAQA